jgi:hypothetical protein
MHPDVRRDLAFLRKVSREMPILSEMPRQGAANLDFHQQQPQQQQGWDEIWQIVLFTPSSTAAITKIARDIFGLAKDYHDFKQIKNGRSENVLTEAQLIEIMDKNSEHQD